MNRRDLINFLAAGIAIPLAPISISAASIKSGKRLILVELSGNYHHDECKNKCHHSMKLYSLQKTHNNQQTSITLQLLKVCQGIFVSFSSNLIVIKRK